MILIQSEIELTVRLVPVVSTVIFPVTYPAIWDTAPVGLALGVGGHAGWWVGWYSS